jgi:transposase
MKHTNKIHATKMKIKHPMMAAMTEHYDHYIAIDWSQTVAVLARLTPNSQHPEICQNTGTTGWIKEYLESLRGHIVLTIEESTATQWLYVELVDYVDRLIVCDPYHNHLLQSGAKTDVIDAVKLCFLLRGGLLKPVFHKVDTLYYLRLLVSTYEDIVKAGVRILNQYDALQRSHGPSFAEHVEERPDLRFIVQRQQEQIAIYEEQKAAYVDVFKRYCSTNKTLHNITQINGIGPVSAVKTLATVLDAHRFPRAHHFLSYCGLVSLPKDSGGRSYGRRQPRYSRRLKSVFKTAALAALNGQNPFREYYDTLVHNGLDPDKARNSVARYLARVVYGMLKNNEPFEPYRWRKSEKAHNK